MAMKSLFTIFVAGAVAACLFAAGMVELCEPAPARAADARVITEGGTNILAIGIDSRDYDVIRFYLRGNRVVELTADDIVHLDRKVLGSPINAGKLAERDAIMAALAAQTNFGAGGLQTAVSNLVRLKVIESLDDGGRPRLAK